MHPPVPRIFLSCTEVISCSSYSHFKLQARGASQQLEQEVVDAEQYSIAQSLKVAKLEYRR